MDISAQIEEAIGNCLEKDYIVEKVYVSHEAYRVLGEGVEDDGGEPGMILHTIYGEYPVIPADDVHAKFVIAIQPLENL